MTLWRVSNHASLDGAGGLRAPGRWHTRGKPIVYCAETAAAASPEILVHAEIDTEDIPVTFRYLEIDAPDFPKCESVDPGDLDVNWPAHAERTRRIGDEWLRSARTAILRVPSVLAPATWNFLINPAHPGSTEIRIARIHPFLVDRRLFAREK